MKAEQILNNQTLRDSLMEKVDVLDKLGELVNIPGTQYYTKAEVAKFYNVGLTAISSLIFDNKEEINKAGYVHKKAKELINENNKDLVVSKKGFKEIGNSVIANGVTGVFERKTVLRIGMLLKESKVAQKLRTYLLEVEEKAPQEIKNNALENIEKEPQQYIINLFSSEENVEVKQDKNIVLKEKYIGAVKKSLESEDINKIMSTTSILINHLLKIKQEEIKTLKADNKQLSLKNKDLVDQVEVMTSRGCTITDSRRVIVEIMKAIIKKTYGTSPKSEDYEEAWNKMYDFAKISTGIDVKKRDEKAKRKTLLDHVSEEEMKILEGFIRCYAMRCGIQPKQILDLNIKLEK